MGGRNISESEIMLKVKSQTLPEEKIKELRKMTKLLEFLDQWRWVVFETQGQ